MSTVLLITAIILFILSLVFSFILAAASKKLNNSYFRQIAVIHLILISIAAFTFFFLKNSLIYHYSVLITSCSGIILSAWAIRNKTISSLIRLYFGIYSLSLILFLYSPSLLIYLVTANLDLFREPQQFKLGENCYLMEQQTMLNSSSDKIQYKIIKKYGIYNKSLARDLNFTARVDSIRILKFTTDSIIVRGYYGKDSTDREIQPGMTAHTIIQKRNK